MYYYAKEKNMKREEEPKGIIDMTRTTKVDV